MFSDGSLIAAHTTTAAYAANLGNLANPQSSYAFRIRRLTVGGDGRVTPGTALTLGITRQIQFWSPDVMVTYNGPMWSSRRCRCAPGHARPWSATRAWKRPKPPPSPRPAAAWTR